MANNSKNRKPSVGDTVALLIVSGIAIAVLATCASKTHDEKPGIFIVIIIGFLVLLFLTKKN